MKAQQLIKISLVSIFLFVLGYSFAQGTKTQKSSQQQEEEKYRKARNKAHENYRQAREKALKNFFIGRAWAENRSDKKDNTLESEEPTPAPIRKSSEDLPSKNIDIKKDTDSDDVTEIPISKKEIEKKKEQIPTKKIEQTPKILNKTPQKADEIQQFKDHVFELVNQERVKANMQPLKYNPLLEQAAQNHSNDMNMRNFYSHTSLDGKTPINRIKATGYLNNNRSYRAAENIALGHHSPKQVMGGWMRSTGHRKNILNPELKEIGIGVTKNKNRNGYSGYYWVQNFGKRHGK